MWRTTFCAAVAGVLLFAGSAKAVTIYGGTGSGTPSQFQFALVTVNESTGALTAIGPASFNTGLDFAPEGRALYGLSSSLRRINPATGAITEIGPLSENGGPPILMADMTIAPNGDIYAVDNASSRSLYLVDGATGAVTRRGTFPDNTIVFPIEFTPDGQLYGGFANLYIIDPANAAIVQDLGPLESGVDRPFIGDLDFGPDGVMRAVETDDFDTPVRDGRLFSIRLDAAPGNRATFLTDIQEGTSVTSIATVPEPSTLTLGSVGVVFAVLFLRRRAA